MALELLLLAMGLLFLHHCGRVRGLPPGPLSVPLLGTLDIFTNYSRTATSIVFGEKFFGFREWCTIYLGPSLVLVLINDFKLAKELFAKEEFSGRPKHYWHEHVKGYHGINMGITNSYGPRWTEQRRFALKHLRDLGFGTKSLDSVMVHEADQVIDRFFEAKEGIVKMKDNFNAAVVNTLWQIVSSKQFDPDAEETKQIMMLLKSQTQGRYSKSMFFPTLFKILPMREVDRKLQILKSKMIDIIEDHKLDIDFHNPRDFIDVYLTQMRENTHSSFNDEQLVIVCLDLIEAGTETTSTTLLWSVLYMALYPQIQKKCQAEIEDKIGSRPPTMDDAPHLPFVMACVMETQRVSMMAPASLPHSLSKDTEVKGYNFPKGTLFIANLSRILMDPEVFSSPKEFNPSRFLDDCGNLMRVEEFAPFSVGRRICMGESLAKNSLFLFFVRVFQRTSVCQTAKRLDPDNAYVGVTRCPNPFEVNVTPR